MMLLIMILGLALVLLSQVVLGSGQDGWTYKTTTSNCQGNYYYYYYYYYFIEWPESKVQVLRLVVLIIGSR